MDQKQKEYKVLGKIFRHFSNLKTSHIIMGGYIFVILVGTILLTLPLSNREGNITDFIDAFFTATSATCVTGLVTLNTLNHWNTFGHVVIISLIQIGGMGFMTIITMFLVVLGKKITLKERLVIQESLNQNDLQGLVKLVKKIVFGTFLIEGIASIILAVRFMFENKYDPLYCLWLGIFHSISSFNNAGFDIMGEVSLENYVGDPIVNVVVMLLIIVGGLGYTVWLDFIRVMRFNKEEGIYNIKFLFTHLSLHTKLVLEITAFLIFFGAAFFFVSEYYNMATMGKLSIIDKVWASLFQSVSTRTAGYATVNQSALLMESKFMTVILMFVGGSPGGTAGGVKTVTMGVLFFSVLSMIKNKEAIESHHKSINIYYLKKALLVILLNLAVVLLGTMILSITEKNTKFGDDFMTLLFEVASATGTVGLTMGITPYISFLGKIVLCICMFIGRVGPVTVAIGLALRSGSGSKGIHYPEEKIFVG